MLRTDSESQKRDGVFVISAWVDPVTDEFRARIMHTTEPGSSDHVTRWAAGPTEVVDLVEKWLRTFGEL